MYAEKVAQEMRKHDHIVDLVFTTRKETLANINTVVLQEKIDYRKRTLEKNSGRSGRGIMQSCLQSPLELRADRLN
jgi:hypothetical protein